MPFVQQDPFWKNELRAAGWVAVAENCYDSPPRPIGGSAVASFSGQGPSKIPCRVPTNVHDFFHVRPRSIENSSLKVVGTMATPIRRDLVASQASIPRSLGASTFPMVPCFLFALSVCISRSQAEDFLLNWLLLEETYTHCRGRPGAVGVPEEGTLAGSPQGSSTFQRLGHNQH